MERTRSDNTGTSAFHKYEPITRLGQLPMLSVGPGSPLNRLTLGMKKLMQKACTGEGAVKGKYALPDGRLDLGKNLPLLASRYAFICSLGEGGSAQVIVAKDHWNPHRREVVIKVMKLQYAKCGEQEIRLLRYLNTCDPYDMAHCVRLISCFSFAGHTCLVLEKLGRSLLDYVGDASKLSRGKFVQQLRKISTQLMTCLAFLRSVGIVHADIKPENILFVQSEAKPSSVRLKVVDFGNAFCAHTDADILLGREVQTPYYRAPEVLLGLRYGVPIDSWSLGCILTEICLQCPLFPCRSPKQLLCQIAVAMGRPPPAHMLKLAGTNEVHVPAQVQPGKPGGGSAFQALTILDADFADLIKHLLEYDPAIRLTPEEGLCHPFCTRLFPFQVLLQAKLPNISRETWLRTTLYRGSISREEPSGRENEKVERSPSKKGPVQAKEEQAFASAKGASTEADENETFVETPVPAQNPIKLRVHRASLTDESPSWLQGIRAPEVGTDRCGMAGMDAAGEGSVADEGNLRKPAFGRFAEEGSMSRAMHRNVQGGARVETKESMQETSSVPEQVERTQEGGYVIAPPWPVKDVVAPTSKQEAVKLQGQRSSVALTRPVGSKAASQQADVEHEPAGPSVGPSIALEGAKAAAGRCAQISAWQKAEQILQETVSELGEGSFQDKSGSGETSSRSEDDAHPSSEGEGTDELLDSKRRRFASSPRGGGGGGLGSDAPARSTGVDPLPSSPGSKRKVQSHPSASRPASRATASPRTTRRRTSTKPWWIASPP